MPKRLLFTLLVVVIILSSSLALAQDNADENGVLNAATAWVIDQQLPDGGWSNGFTEGADPGATADTIFALATAGVDVSALESAEGNTPLGYLAAYLQTTETLTPGMVAKIATALTAIGENPEEFAGQTLVQWLLDSQNEAGVFVDDMAGVYGHCLVMIALYNAGGGEPIESLATALEAGTGALVNLQDSSGGWGFTADSAPDTNTTAVCIQALAYLGTDAANEAVGSALEYLGAIQNDDGGWPYQNPSDYGTDSDANSTSLVVQALIAADVEPDAWNAEGICAFLTGLQNESGSFSFSSVFSGDNFLATIGVMPVLTGYAYSDAYLLPAMMAASAEG